LEDLDPAMAQAKLFKQMSSRSPLKKKKTRIDENQWVSNNFVTNEDGEEFKADQTPEQSPFNSLKKKNTFVENHKGNDSVYYDSRPQEEHESKS